MALIFPYTKRYILSWPLSFTGLTPQFVTLKKLSDLTTVTPAPTIHELSNGSYYFDWVYNSANDADVFFLINANGIVGNVTLNMDDSTTKQDVLSVSSLGPITESFIGGGGTAFPTVTSVSAPTRSSLTVMYSANMLMDASTHGVLNLSNYAITHASDGTPLTISLAAPAGLNGVTLTTANQTPSDLYYLSVQNVQDTNGNQIQ